MSIKHILIILVVCFLYDVTHGQSDKKFFRKDYIYLESTDSFYKIHTSARNWRDSKIQCELEGAGLFYPDNKDEADFVLQFYKSNPSYTHPIWIGLSDQFVEGLFETVDGKSIFDMYVNWAPHEPNNSGNGEDCVVYYTNGLFNDVPCDLNYRFICKKSRASLQWNYACDIPNLDYTFNNDTSKCYKFHTTPLNWTEAYVVCRSEQSHLAMINSRLEADYLAKLTEVAPRIRVTENYVRGIYHLGFRNRFQYGWQTVKGTPLSFNDSPWWGNYNPYTEASPYPHPQCGSMFYNGVLSYNDCDTKCFFICEHEVKIIPTTINEENNTFEDQLPSLPT